MTAPEWKIHFCICEKYHLFERETPGPFVLAKRDFQETLVPLLSQTRMPFSQVVIEIPVHSDGLLCFSELSLVFPQTVLLNVLAPFFSCEVEQISEVFKGKDHN